MGTRIIPLLDLLLANPSEVVVVGTGSQAQTMRRVLASKLRVRMHEVVGCSSLAAPPGKAAYLVCATPATEAIVTLRAKGVPAEAIATWSEMASVLDAIAPTAVRRRLGLSSVDESFEPIPDGQETPAALRSNVGKYIGDVLTLSLSASEAQDSHSHFVVQKTAELYLAWLAGHMAHRQFRERRLLIPMPGRLAAGALTQSLTLHRRVALRVGFASPNHLVANALALHRSARCGAAVPAALFAILLERFDCLIGPCAGLLLPYLGEIAGYDCSALRIERTEQDWRESILMRNAEIAAVDALLDQISAADRAAATLNGWDEWSRERKVEWCVEAVEDATERGLVYCTGSFRVRPASIRTGLAAALASLGWPEADPFPTQGSLPRDCIFTFGNRPSIHPADIAVPFSPRDLTPDNASV